MGRDLGQTAFRTRCELKPISVGLERQRHGSIERQAGTHAKEYPLAHYLSIRVSALVVDQSSRFRA